MSEQFSSQGWSQAWARRPEGALVAVGAAIVLFAAHWLWGAQRSEIAMVMVGFQACLLAVVLATPALRGDLARLGGLSWIALGFGLVLAATLWSLTPLVPGGPHPVWAYVGRTGSASIDRSATQVEIINLVGLACAFLVGSALGASDKRASFALKALLFTGAAFFAWAFVAYVSGDRSAQYGGRLAGHFMAANTAATLAGCLAILAACLTLRASRDARKGRRLSAVLPPASLTAFFVVVLALTASRAGMAATAAGLLIVGVAHILMRRASLGRVALGAIVAVLVIGGLVVLVGDLLVTRYFKVGDDFSIRAAMVEAHWQAFLASPVNGYGLGSFHAINRIYITPRNIEALWNVNAVHNVYVQWLEEGGLAAAIPMWATLAAVMALCVRGAIRRERMKLWLVGLIACDVTVLLHGWTDFALQTPSFAATWALLLGLQFSLATGSKKKRLTAAVWTAPAAGAMAAVAVVGAMLVLAALPNGAAKAGPLTLMELAAGYGRAAERTFEAAKPSAAALDASEAASRAAIAQSPYDTNSWARLALIDRLRNGRLTAAGLKALSVSYDLAPLDRFVARWRIRFALENWQDLDPQVRRAAQNEALVFLKTPALAGTTRKDLGQISNPTGVMIAAFWLNQAAQGEP